MLAQAGKVRDESLAGRGTAASAPPLDANELLNPPIGFMVATGQFFEDLALVGRERLAHRGNHQHAPTQPSFAGECMPE
jgi:hypothetical protein